MNMAECLTVSALGRQLLAIQPTTPLETFRQVVKLRQFLERQTHEGWVHQTFAYADGFSGDQLDALTVLATQAAVENLHDLPRMAIQYVGGTCANTKMGMVANSYLLHLKDLDTATAAQLRLAIDAVIVLSDILQQYAKAWAAAPETAGAIALA
jgi:hypothetical protein